MKIYFKNVKRTRNDTVETIIKKSFCKQRIIGYNYFKETIFENGKKEYYKARRSFEDLYKILTSYFPNLTKKKLAKVLIKLCLDTSNDIIFRYCSDIQKWVLQSWGLTCSSVIIYRYSDRSNISNKGKGKYSITDILNLIK